MQSANMAEPEQRQEQSATFPCPACGGKMVFDPKSQQLKCQHCGNAIAVDAIKKSVTTHDFKAAPRQAAGSDWQKGERVIKCESCGAQSVIDEHTTATFCPFCGAPRVVADQSSGGISPETLIPFSIDENSAKGLFKKWVNGLKMAPGVLKQSAVMGKLTGVYLPHWAFDTSTFSHYVGQAGYHYYETEHYTEEEDGKTVEKTRQVQKTRWTPTSGVVAEDFDDVTVPASTHVNLDLLEAVEPFSLDKLIDYKPEFISGFMAEKASVDIDAGWGKAKEEIDRRIEDMCRSDILDHADEARVTHVNTNYNEVCYKQFLLPVWLSSYRFKGKVYQFVINGETGRVKGKYPKSKVKIALIVAAILLIVAAIVYFSQDSGEAAALAENMLRSIGMSGALL